MTFVDTLSASRDRFLNLATKEEITLWQITLFTNINIHVKRGKYVFPLALRNSKTSLNFLEITIFPSYKFLLQAHKLSILQLLQIQSLVIQSYIKINTTVVCLQKVKPTFNFKLRRKRRYFSKLPRTINFFIFFVFQNTYKSVVAQISSAKEIEGGGREVKYNLI